MSSNRPHYTPDAARLATLRRAFDVVKLLAQEDLTLQQIADRLGVSPRTVRRDLYALQAVGVDIIRVDHENNEDGGAEWPGQPGESSHTATLRVDVRSWHGLIFLSAAA